MSRFSGKRLPFMSKKSKATSQDDLKASQVERKANVALNDDTYNGQETILTTHESSISDLFTTTFAHASLGTAFLDIDMKLMYFNPVLQTQLGISRGKQADVRRGAELKALIGDEYSNLVNLHFEQLITGVIKSFEQDLKFDALQEENEDPGSVESLLYTMHLSGVYSKSGRFLFSVLQLVDHSDSSLLSKHLEFSAQHDDLTGFVNRRVLEKQIEVLNRSCAQDGTPFSLLIINMLGLAALRKNEKGEIADDTLAVVSRELKSVLRASDMTARLNNDEFAILLPNSKVRNAQIVGNKIVQAVDMLDMEDGRARNSIGVLEVLKPYSSTATILQSAIAASYGNNKGAQEGIYVIKEGDEQISGRHSDTSIIDRVNEAIDKDHFTLLGQPQVALNNPSTENRIEVLIRLQNPENGRLTSPGAFLPVVELYGLSSKLDRWVMQNIVKIAHEQIAAGQANNSYWLNISDYSLHDGRFLEFLITLVSDAGLPKGCLNFEITEKAMTDNLQAVGKIMRSLKPFGCRFALDDFGSGLSSFSHIKTLPIDSVKIHARYIKDILVDDINRIFVESVINISHAMDVMVVAEYVESKEIANLLTRMNADYGQGFALGKPAMFK